MAAAPVNSVARDVTPCDLVDIHQCFKKPAVSIFYPEDVGNEFLGSSKYLPDDTASSQNTVIFTYLEIITASLGLFLQCCLQTTRRHGPGDRSLYYFTELNSRCFSFS
jgi:hypothetical protein